MTLASGETIFGLLDCSKNIQIWWGYPSMHSLLEYHQTLKRILCITKKFRVKIVTFVYRGLYLVVPSNYRQCQNKLHCHKINNRWGYVWAKFQADWSRNNFGRYLKYHIWKCHNLSARHLSITHLRSLASH